MLFRNDETKEEREAREDMFGSKLSAAADETPTMEVDRPPTLTQNVPLIPPDEGPYILEPREVLRLSPASVQPAPAQPAAAPVKMFGMMGTNVTTGFSNPANLPADSAVASSTSPVESHQAPLSSTPFIRTAPAPTVLASEGSTSAPAMPSVWPAGAAGEGEDEDEEMPEINIESDSE